MRVSLFAVITTILTACHCAVADEPGSEVDARRQPNLILILADDLGFETIGANGGTSYRTPAIDQLAETGARFTHCFVQPLCTPTRAQLMTGQYNVRNYRQFGSLDPDSQTFANMLKYHGYSTCITGKWQLGQDKDLPRKSGFDEHCLWQHTRRPPRYVNPGLEINGESKDFTSGEYGPDIVNEYALEFITKKKDQPFFLYYPMMLAHGPYLATPDSADWDPKATGEDFGKAPRHFGEMVEYMDKLIGRLVARLEELQLRDNTLILFVGDNGTGKGTRSMMGDRVVIGGKGTTTAAGMHVPLIANWPEKIAAGTVHTDLVDSTDFLPTLLEAAGVSPPMDAILDGRSFLPQLKGKPGTPRDWIYSWYWPHPDRNDALREFAFNHRYKLYRTGEFFDLEQDREENSPMEVASLTGDASAAAVILQSALDQFKEARPVDNEQIPRKGNRREKSK